jgi:hypothetical protein
VNRVFWSSATSEAQVNIAEAEAEIFPLHFWRRWWDIVLFRADLYRRAAAEVSEKRI